MTEENKLTLEDCFKYPEAPLINQLKLRCENLTEFIKAVDGHDLEFILQDDGFKLILRDISQLTDEEKKHIVENFLCFQENYKTFSCGVEYLFNCSFNETTNYSVELADYLRKKNIMIENPNWFEIGKAVKG